MFARHAPDVACLQGRLVIDNADDNALTKMFALEYAALFDVINPGLLNAGAPVLLGGTTRGVIELFSRESRKPDSDLLEMMATVASQIGQFVERKRAEDALRESEGRFRGLMEQAPFSVQLFAPDGRTLSVNRAWEELWGVTLAQIGGYNVLEDPQLEEQGALSHLRRAFEGEAALVPAVRYDPNQTIPGQTRHREPVRWVTAVAYPLKDGAGKVGHEAKVLFALAKRLFGAALGSSSARAARCRGQRWRNRGRFRAEGGADRRPELAGPFAIRWSCPAALNSRRRSGILPARSPIRS